MSLLYVHTATPGAVHTSYIPSRLIVMSELRVVTGKLMVKRRLVRFGDPQKAGHKTKRAQCDPTARTAPIPMPRVDPLCRSSALAPPPHPTQTGRTDFLGSRLDCRFTLWPALPSPQAEQSATTKEDAAYGAPNDGSDQ